MSTPARRPARRTIRNACDVRIVPFLQRQSGRRVKSFQPSIPLEVEVMTDKVEARFLEPSNQLIPQSVRPDTQGRLHHDSTSWRVGGLQLPKSEDVRG